MRIYQMVHVLQGWIAAKWKPKAHFDLQLGSKGFLTIIFHHMEDKARVEEGGLYFFNSVGLYLRNWVECFCPEKEDFSWAPSWIHMFSLPQEYWDESTLQEIGNTLGSYFRSTNQTRMNKFTSYARICVFMHIAQVLPDTICLSHEDSDWIQSLDYEHIPFRCQKCHEHGHLFRDFPLNKSLEKPNPHISDEQGFQYMARRKRNHKRPMQENIPKHPPSTNNSFQVLEDVTMDPKKKI